MPSTGLTGMIMQAGDPSSKYSSAKEVKLILITLSQVKTNMGSLTEAIKLL